MLAQFVGQPKKFEQPMQPEYAQRRDGIRVDHQKIQQSIRLATETKKSQIDQLLKQAKRMADAYFQSNDRTLKSDDVSDGNPNSDNLTDRSQTPLNSVRSKSAEENKVNFTQITDEILFEEQNKSTQLLSTDGEAATTMPEQN